jgi:hypothetical protein
MDGSARLSGWSVVATVRARSEYIDRFIRHYLGYGAYQIILFFDDPDISFYQESPSVTGVICDERYWKSIGKFRPDEVEHRQLENLNYGISLIRTEWVLHVDADELVISTTDINEVLKQQPEDVFSVVAPPVEAVYEASPSAANAFDARWFKRPLREDEDWSILSILYGELSTLTMRGLFGHVGGKTFIRARYKIKTPSLHLPQPCDASLRSAVVVPCMELLHFDSLTFADWREKWMRRFKGEVIAVRMSERRRRQMKMIGSTYERAGDAGLMELYKKMYILDPDRLAVARSAGLLVERNL